MCRKTWGDRADFLGDPQLRLVGYQACFEVLEFGLILFTHHAPNCGTTLSRDVGSLLDLYDGPVYEERRTGAEDCPGYCLQRDNLEPCPARCACAAIREVVQILKVWPKRLNPQDQQ